MPIDKSTWILVPLLVVIIILELHGRSMGVSSSRGLLDIAPDSGTDESRIGGEDPGSETRVGEESSGDIPDGSRIGEVAVRPEVELLESPRRVQEDYPCVMMTCQPSTWICLYTREEDVRISAGFHDGRVFEASCVDKVMAWIAEFPGAGLLDIGANLGTYTLPAAARGHLVIAVEPNPQTADRLYKAVRMGGLEGRVKVVRNAVSNVRNVAYLTTKPTKRGSTVVGQNPNNGTQSVWTILMSDLRPLITFKQAVMKIDVEAHEHFAFAYADELFDYVDVHRIFMEWQNVNDRNARTTSDEEHRLFNDMLGVLYRRGFRPYPCHPCSTDKGQPLRDGEFDQWPRNVCWYR